MATEEYQDDEVTRVLLVEDDEEHAELIKRAFSRHSRPVRWTVACNVAQATEELAHLTPHLVILDSLLPDGRGIDLMRSDEPRSFPVIVLTTHGDEREAVEVVKAGALNYVVKSDRAFAELPQVAESTIREWKLIEQAQQAERALRESEERFRNLIEGSIQGILVAHYWKPLFVNQAYADILGYSSPEAILSLPSGEALFAPWERERLWSYHRARLCGEDAPTHYEFDAVRRDGSIVSLQNTVRRVIWNGEPAVQSVVVDITDRKRAEMRLQYQAGLEELMTNVSAKLIRLSSAEIDHGIAEVLQELAEFMDVDRAYVVLFLDEYLTLTAAYEWCRAGVSSVRGTHAAFSSDAMPWVVARHKEGEIVFVPRVSELGDEADSDKRCFSSFGVKSLVSVPLVIQGAVRGFLGFDCVREERLWTDEVISLLMIVGETLAGVMARKEFEDSLRKSEQRFKDFADIAADWFWEMDVELHFNYLSERYKDIVGVDPNEHLGLSPSEIFSHQTDEQDKWSAFLARLEEREPFDIEIRWLRSDRVSRVMRLMGRPRTSEDGVFAGYRGVGRDVTDAYRMTAQIAHQASHDALTGLVNRREFERRLDRAVANARQHGSQYVLAFLDLDQFKMVNDIAGHAAGDLLLKRVAVLLGRKVRGRDTLARLGGDEFSLLLENCPLAKALEISNGMLSDVRGFRFSWEERTFDVGLSIGLVSVNHHSESATRVLAQADLACYTAKRLGKNRVHVHQMEDAELERRQYEIRRIADLRDALENDRFRLYTQPIVSLGDAEDVHFELLLRLLDSAGEILLPDVFIPIAERYGLMVPIDRWVIRTAFRESWDILSNFSESTVAINLSGNSLNDENLLGYVLEEFEASGMPPERVCFEITETAAIDNFDRASMFIATLKSHGCRFALDDFGSGVSSFTYLKHLPVDFLKIDGSFVRDMAEEPVDRAMVAAIHQVGRIMGIRTIAECADSKVVVAQLRDLGVDYVQGNAVGPALPLADAARRPMVRTASLS